MRQAEFNRVRAGRKMKLMDRSRLSLPVVILDLGTWTGSTRVACLPPIARRFYNCRRPWCAREGARSHPTPPAPLPALRPAPLTGRWVPSMVPMQARAGEGAADRPQRMEAQRAERAGAASAPARTPAQPRALAAVRRERVAGASLRVAATLLRLTVVFCAGRDWELWWERTTPGCRPASNVCSMNQE